MLCGCSHDPIHQDIFTPLAIGGAVCIPAPEDIAPGRLARWIQEVQVSVTNLTPAMGQVLAEGAAANGLTCLRRAFFVGDVLTSQQVR